MLNFRIFGFPVSVHWSFWVLAAFLGMGRQRTELVLSWIVVVFVSVLAHELGHAFTARAFGMRPAISLYSMGGLTMWRSSRAVPHSQRIAISLAGPFAGFAFAAVVLILTQTTSTEQLPLLARVAIFDLLWVNVVWGAVNLLPILPLDGGHVMRSIVQSVRGFADEITPRKISVVTGGLLVLLALYLGMWWAAMVAGFITWSNVAALRGPSHPTAY
jgi:Zn-dependent protease